MAIMYNRPMTEEEERMMMAQSLKNNNMMMADANMIGPEVMTDADAAMLNERSRGAELIPPGADMSQYNVIDPSSVVRESEMLNQGMNLKK